MKIKEKRKEKEMKRKEKKKKKKKKSVPLEDSHPNNTQNVIPTLYTMLHLKTVT